jgi:hypothetical protein
MWINLDKLIDEYIKKQQPQLKEIILKVRKIFFNTLPNCTERKTWGVIALGNDKFYIAAMKNRVHIGFSIEGLSSEEIALFEGNGKTMRHIKIHSLDEIDENELVKLITLVDKKAHCIKR